MAEHLNGWFAPSIIEQLKRVKQSKDYELDEEQERILCEIMRKKRYSDKAFDRRYCDTKGNLSQLDIYRNDILNQWYKIAEMVYEHKDWKEVRTLMDRLAECVPFIGEKARLRKRVNLHLVNTESEEGESND